MKKEYKRKKGNWEKEARRLFNPYGEELNFTERDWEVFLNRMREIVRIVLEEARIK